MMTLIPDPKDLIGGIPVADRCNSIQRKITQVFWSQVVKGTTQFTNLPPSEVTRTKKEPQS